MTLPIERTLLDAARRLRVTPYWVGGPVRDRLLNRVCHDWDIVTPRAQPLAKAVARRLQAKLITLDEQYRIYRLIQGDSTIDFAEMQGKTIEQDLARRDFTINAMAMPLDEPLTLTLSPEERGANSFFPLPRGEGLRVRGLIDPFNGQQDLKKRIVRAVSRQAFVEDPIRLLRAYRFSAQFKFTIDPQTVRWIAKESHRLQAGGERGVARERVREELLRLLSQEKAGETLAAMDRTGLLTTIFPELEAGRRVAARYYGKGGVVKHQLHSVLNVEWILQQIETVPLLPSSRNAVVKDKLKAYIHAPLGGFPRFTYLKLAALLHDIGKPATAEMIRGRLRFFGHDDVGAKLALRVLQQLRFSRQESQIVQAWVRHHMRLGSLAASGGPSDKATARFFRDLGEEGIGMLIVSLGDHYDYLARAQWGKGKDPVEKTADALLRRYFLQRDSVVPPKIIDGHDLMKALRLKPGPTIGRLLEAVRDGQAEGTVKTKQEAITYAKKALKKVLRAVTAGTAAA